MSGSGMPVPLMSVSREYALESWVKTRCPKEGCFTFIAKTNALLSESLSDTDEQSLSETIRVILAEYLVHEGSLASYVLSLQKSIGSDDLWDRIVRAAAWRILEAFQSSSIVSKGHN